MPSVQQQPAILALSDGRIFHGFALGCRGSSVGEVCFNTSITGYQEILSDPSYQDQLITFTTPHIGNVGTNSTDMESKGIAAKGMIVRQSARITSNYRSQQDLDDWLMEHDVVAICGIDTRALTRHLRNHGALNGVIASDGTSAEALVAQAQAWSGLEGRDLVAAVSTDTPYHWHEGGYHLNAASYGRSDTKFSVVVLDFGCKKNILRMLSDRSIDLQVVPASTSAEAIVAMKPSGIFLSNGPGDPSAVGYAVETIRQLLKHDIPIFGICMGHQLLCQALGLTTFKLKFGHRGGNHPVQQESGVEISSQNHGFAVADDPMPDGIEVTHRSLFDGTIEGISLVGRSVFSVQYHPEASPGPHDGCYLFDRFATMVQTYGENSR